MGKLRFTLVNLWFWATMILMNFLTENLPLVGNSKSGFDITSLVLISLSAILCLFMFYFINHKKNKITVDFVLLPSIIIVGFVMMIAIWVAQDTTYVFANGAGSNTATISVFEKIRATIILIIFLTFTYAFTFMMRVNALRNRQFYWLIYAGIITAYISLIASIILEHESYALIFKEFDPDKMPTISIDSFYGNKNYYGGVLFVGFLCCIAANYYKPRFFNYISMVILFLATLASASVLPTIISMVALPLYLIEEIIRFGIKRKWLPCLFTTLTTLIGLTIIIVFFIGVQKEWNNFNGLDIYINKVLSSKNFKTITGRVTIWDNIYIYLFDKPFSSLFGHGFMVSEKNILAITGAMNNSFEGVRTTHNGYVQIVFEYGALGALLYIILLSYFVYGCIRLLIEKRFHFVLVYSFIVLCCCVYNMAESSSFFDSGVKEMFITMTFVMPIIAETKSLSRRKKIEEIKSIQDKTTPLNYMSLAKGLAVIGFSLVICTALLFISSTTYQVGWLKWLMLNILIGAIIGFLFIPYLVSLYYRKTIRPIFVLNLVTNTLIIGFITFLLIYTMSHYGISKKVMPYFVPMALIAMLTFDTLIYAMAKNGSIGEWWETVFHGSILIPRYAMFGAIVIGGLITLIAQITGSINLFNYWFLYGLNFIGFYMVLHFLPTKEGKKILDEYNELGMTRVHKIYLKDEKYDG